MACYRPNTGYKVLNKITGKIEVVFGRNKITNDMTLLSEVELPCGKCQGCRLAKSAEWAMRCQLESGYYLDNYFLTLTYDDAHLPIRDHVSLDKSTGEVLIESENAVLVPEHMTKFLKDLRRYYEYHYNHTGIRYFLAGEYGEKTLRPHYHMIVFNLPIFDLKLYKESFSGNNLYNSVILNHIWGKGYVAIGNVTYESCAYVARYTTKKIGINKDDYLAKGLEPEFVRMSRRPGIGYQYFKDNEEKIKKNDNIILKRGDNAVSFKPSRYFDTHFLDEDEQYQVKMKRMRVAELSEKIEMSGTDLDRSEYLKIKEQAKDREFKSVRRDI